MTMERETASAGLASLAVAGLSAVLGEGKCSVLSLGL